MKKIILTIFIISSAILSAQKVATIDIDEVKPLLFENYIQGKNPELWKLYQSHTGAEEEKREKQMMEAMSKGGGINFDAKFLADQQRSTQNRMKLDSEGKKFITEFLIESGISEEYDLILFSGYRRNIAYTKSNPEDITQFLIQELIRLGQNQSR